MKTFLKLVPFCVVIALSLVLNSVASFVSTGDYNKDFYVTWAPEHVTTSGLIRTLKMDIQSGSGFGSNDKFIFGQFDMQMQLIKGNSAGTVATFYLIKLQSDTGNHRDEIDFEFLGNVAGQPYTLQTNVFTNGTGCREQRFHLWFDPTEGFNTYSIFWNIYQIVFKVNGIPIWTYRNHMDQGVEYPSQQPMNLLASLWNGETWATNGGHDKIDWSKAPFIVYYRKYTIDACKWSGDAKVCADVSPSNWWNGGNYSTLTESETNLLKWVGKNFRTYDYCQDFNRFNGSLPKECNLPMY